jgi:hypothetical protein
MGPSELRVIYKLALQAGCAVLKNGRISIDTLLEVVPIL